MYQWVWNQTQMNKQDSFFKVVQRGEEGDIKLLGTAFPINKNGGLLTCRHVVEIEDDGGQSSIGLMTNHGTDFIAIDKIKYPEIDGLDLDIAYLTSTPLQNGKFFELLEPKKILVGEGVYSFGYMIASSDEGQYIEEAYLKGNIVNFQVPERNRGVTEVTLSYPVIEGMSGSPILTYHSGVKLVGLAHGSVSSRVIAHEHIDYKESEVELRETIHRIVEFGRGYHTATLIAILEQMGVRFTLRS